VLWTVELEMLVAVVGFNTRAIMWYTEPIFMYDYTVKVRYHAPPTHPHPPARH
jgi:hypothetical protein